MSSQTQAQPHQPQKPEIYHAKGAVIVGGGPAGLMAAQVLLEQGIPVDLFEAMPTVARKFLYAGKSGMNITHAEATETFLTRYGKDSMHKAHPSLIAAVEIFDNTQVKHWVESFGIDTFIGSSGRVFPTGMKAAPLLRSWLHHLKDLGLTLHTRHKWLGWQESQLCFETPDGIQRVSTQTTLLALGGGSWKKLGSDGYWIEPLSKSGFEITPLSASNCGFQVSWPEAFQQQFAGVPVKGIRLTTKNPAGDLFSKSGDLMITTSGIEGGLIYGISAPLRDQILAAGAAELTIDLLPAREETELYACLQQRGKKSVSQTLKQLRLSPVKEALLKQLTDKDTYQTPEKLAKAIKTLCLTLTKIQPLDEAISTAGGVCFEQLDEGLMSKKMPGLFFAGEMLDWEAPTGGYLLTACLATGYLAGQSMAKRIRAVN